jgi:hypothetical protein
MKQDELGQVLRQMTPPVDDTGVWDSIQNRANPEAPGGRSERLRKSRRFSPRLASYALATILVLVGVGFGVNALAQRLGSDDVIVITDETMSPGGTGPGPTYNYGYPPAQEVVLTAPWGNGPGEFGRYDMLSSQAFADFSPQAFAISAETGTGRIIAVGDDANWRVQFFRWGEDGETAFLRAVDLPLSPRSSQPILRDIVIDPDGNTYVLRSGDEVFALRPDSDEAVRVPLDEGVSAVRLYLNGFALYVQEEDGTCRGVEGIFDLEGGPGDRLREAGIMPSSGWADPMDGVPVPGSSEGRIVSLEADNSASEVEVRVSSNSAELTEYFVLGYNDLNIASASLLGQDANSDIWVLVHINPGGQSKKEFLRAHALAKGEGSVGALSVMVTESGPLDIFLDPPSGDLFLMRRTDEGIAIDRYAHSQLVRATTPPDGESTSTTWATAGEFVTVSHPYRHEGDGGVLYEAPGEITLAPGLSLPEFPVSVLAWRLRSELPETDLALVPQESLTGLYSDSFVSADELLSANALGSTEDEAVQAARAFLAQHGLWSDSYGEPGVFMLDSQPVWIVNFPGEILAEGIEQYAMVRVGEANKVLTLAFYMPRREDLEDKHIRLRPVEEVLADPELWQMSYCQGLGGSTQVEEPLEVEVRGVTLEYRDPGTGDELIAVPVYVFDVAIQGFEQGVLHTEWEVLAALDVEPKP